MMPELTAMFPIFRAILNPYECLDHINDEVMYHIQGWTSSHRVNGYYEWSKGLGTGARGNEGIGGVGNLERVSIDSWIPS